MLRIEATDQAPRCTHLNTEIARRTADSGHWLPLPWSDASGDVECELGQAADAAAVGLARRAAAGCRVPAGDQAGGRRLHQTARCRADGPRLRDRPVRRAAVERC